MTITHPNPWRSRAHGGGDTHLGLGAKQGRGQSPAAFCCPIPCPAGLQDSETEMLPRRLLTPLTSAFYLGPQPHSLPASQLLVYLLQSRLHRAPALHLPSPTPRAPPAPLAEAPGSAPNLITKTLCAVAPPISAASYLTACFQTNSLWSLNEPHMVPLGLCTGCSFCLARLSLLGGLECAASLFRISNITSLLSLCLSCSSLAPLPSGPSPQPPVSPLQSVPHVILCPQMTLSPHLLLTALPCLHPCHPQASPRPSD